MQKHKENSGGQCGPRISNSQNVFATRRFRGGCQRARPRFRCPTLQLHFLRARCPMPPCVPSGPSTACAPLSPVSQSPMLPCPMPLNPETYFLREWCTVPVPGARLVSLVPGGPRVPSPQSPTTLKLHSWRAPHLVPTTVCPVPRAACSKCFCFDCAIRQWRRGACADV